MRMAHRIHCIAKHLCISDERAERYCASVTGGLGLDAAGDSGAFVGANTRLDEGKQFGLSIMSV